MNNKRKLFFAVISLLLCLSVLLSASFAWFSLTRAPEITGVDTYVGSNGSLELALLSDETYMDPSLIRSSIGDSVIVQETVQSNLSWGNVLDLSDESYGLNQICMIPARLNTVPGDDGQTVVCANMLMVPKFGIDGRFSEFESNTVSAVFGGEKFSYLTGSQTYGVRGIGSIAGMSPQQSALANARTKVRSNQAASLSTASAVWAACGSEYLDLMYRRYELNETVFSNSDLALIEDMATQLLSAVNYLDLALRQAVVGYAASTIADEETFRMLRENVENTVIPLSVIVDQANAALPKGFEELIMRIETDKMNMQLVITACHRLAEETAMAGQYPWDTIHGLTSELLDENATYLGEEKLGSFEAFAQLPLDSTLTISPSSGIMAHIADYSGNYRQILTFSKAGEEDPRTVEVVTTSSVSPSHMENLTVLLESCTAAAGDTSVREKDLIDVFGYAVDLAFRCNERSQLLLQTAPESRTGDGSDSASTQGSGSNMRFQSEQLTSEQVLLMMDAIRIGFLDNQDNLVGIAKLNITNYTETEDGISAPLYLYDYTVRTDGSIAIGERLEEQSPIMGLPKGVPVILSAVVWLDGDYVDNSLAGVSAQTMTGSLNLQFSSSVNLIPSQQNVKG